MARPDAFHVYDTTLRDGAQREGISYSVADKLAVARLLDDYGVGFIEGGWPGRDAQGHRVLRAGPHRADAEERRAGRLRRHPQGRRQGRGRPAGPALLDSQAPVITVVAKSDVRHVAEALRTTNEENLAMVQDTVALPRGRGPPGVRRHGALLRRLQARPGLRRQPAGGCSRGRRVRRRPVRHQRRDAAARHVRDRHRRQGALGRSPGHPLPGRHRLRHRELGLRGRGRRDARAVHRQRLRRAHRQRRPVRRGAQPAAQAGHRLPARGRPRRDRAASRTRSPRSPTSRRTPISPTPAGRRSRTRRACTRARSRSTPSCTTTSTRRSSATSRTSS